MTDIDLLFVYGTLRRALGQPAHQLVASVATYVADAHCQGTLYDLGPYPGLSLADPGGRTLGELYRLAAAHRVDALARLDEYEGVRAGEIEACAYRRVVVDVTHPSGTDRAWVYELFRIPADALIVPHGDYARAIADKDTPGHIR